MSAVPKLTVKYAWDSDEPFGSVYDSEEQAREAAPYSKYLYDLLRLYVDANGRIVHTEPVEEAS